MGKCHAAVVIEDVCGNRPVRWGGGGKKKSLHSGEYCRETTGKLLLKWTV